MASSQTRGSTPRLSELARKLVVPEGVVGSGWPAVESVCRSKLGVTFDPWQVGAGRLILAKRADGSLASQVDGVGLSLMRQVGKTYLVGALIFALCLLRPGLLVIWSAHHARTHGETFLAMQGFAKRSRVAPWVLQVFTGSGDEEIRFRNGSRILFGARERGFGRGIPGVDVLVFDEAQILSDRALANMLATMNVSRFGLALYVGTPPRPEDNSESFTRMRSDAWSGRLRDGAWLEFGAAPGVDAEDRATWGVNPSFPARTPVASVLRLKRKLSAADFLREGLGVWDATGRAWSVVPEPAWSGLVGAGPADGVRPDALALDMSPDRVLSVGACWLVGDAAHVEEVWSGADTSAAVEWLADRGRRVPVVVAASSPAASLLPALRAQRLRVRTLGAFDVARACGLFFDDAMSGRLSQAGQPQLGDALAGAAKKPVGGAGGWCWVGSDESVEVHPLVGVTLARFAAEVGRRPVRPTGGRVLVLS